MRGCNILLCLFCLTSDFTRVGMEFALLPDHLMNSVLCFSLIDPYIYSKIYRGCVCINTHRPFPGAARTIRPANATPLPTPPHPLRTLPRVCVGAPPVAFLSPDVWPDSFQVRRTSEPIAGQFRPLLARTFHNAQREWRVVVCRSLSNQCVSALTAQATVPKR